MSQHKKHGILESAQHPAPGMITNALFTSRAAAESNSTVGSPFSEEEEDHCLLNLGFYGICAMFNLKT